MRLFYGRVKKLDMSKCKGWTDAAILHTVGLFPQLTSLSLRRCSAFANVRALPFAVPRAKLRYLNLDSVRIAPQDAAAIAQYFPSLEALVLDRSGINDDAVRSPAARSLVCFYSFDARRGLRGGC